MLRLAPVPVITTLPDPVSVSSLPARAAVIADVITKLPSCAFRLALVTYAWSACWSARVAAASASIHATRLEFRTITRVASSACADVVYGLNEEAIRASTCVVVENAPRSIFVAPPPGKTLSYCPEEGFLTLSESKTPLVSPVRMLICYST